MLARQEATPVAELFAALHLVDEIYLQYGQSGHFSTDMLIRLALAERDAMILSRRYEMLENSERSGAEKNFDNYDTYCTMLASFLNLRVKYMRTCVDVQENPQFVKHSSEYFSELLKDNINLWDTLLNKSDKMKDEIDVLTAQLKNVKSMNLISKKSLEVDLAKKKDEYSAVMAKERVILKDFHSLIATAKQISETAVTPTIPTLIYWHDSEGEHCIATSEQVLDADA
jgi:hypothetical protein